MSFWIKRTLKKLIKTLTLQFNWIRLARSCIMQRAWPTSVKQISSRSRNHVIWKLKMILWAKRSIHLVKLWCMTKVLSARCSTKGSCSDGLEISRKLSSSSQKSWTNYQKTKPFTLREDSCTRIWAITTWRSSTLNMQSRSTLNALKPTSSMELLSWSLDKSRLLLMISIKLSCWMIKCRALWMV